MKKLENRVLKIEKQIDTILKIHKQILESLTDERKVVDLGGTGTVGVSMSPSQLKSLGIEKGNSVVVSSDIERGEVVLKIRKKK